VSDPLTPKTITIPEGDGDGVYRVGKLTKDAKFLRVKQETEIGSYRRHTMDNGNIIVFVKV
jgi:hypothetical protein